MYPSKASEHASIYLLDFKLVCMYLCCTVQVTQESLHPFFSKKQNFKGQRGWLAVSQRLSGPGTENGALVFWMRLEDPSAKYQRPQVCCVWALPCRQALCRIVGFRSSFGDLETWQQFAASSASISQTRFDGLVKGCCVSVCCISDHAGPCEPPTLRRRNPLGQDMCYRIDHYQPQNN